MRTRESNAIQKPKRHQIKVVKVLFSTPYTLYQNTHLTVGLFAGRLSNLVRLLG